MKSFFPETAFSEKTLCAKRSVRVHAKGVGECAERSETPQMKGPVPQDWSFHLNFQSTISTETFWPVRWA